MRSVTVLGLGRMGQGLARRYLEAGYAVTVWNRDPSKAAALVAAGARQAATPREAATAAEAIVAMVADDAASRAVWFGDDGALAQAPRGALAIECSTLSADHVGRLAAAARDAGLAYIDCPVTGLPDAAAAGKLTLLVGAAPEDLARAEPFLTPIGNAVRHFGPVGAGTGYKLMINLMGAVQIAALAEGLALSERLGLDRDAVLQALETSQAASPQVVRYARRMSARDFAQPTFTSRLRHKDASYGAALARAAGVPAPLGEAATAWFAAAMAIQPDADEATLIETVLAKAARPEA